MARIENRKGRSYWVAVYTMGGKRVVKSTGVPLKDKGRSSAVLKKLAQDTADAMEEAANGNRTMQAIQDSIRKAAANAGTAPFRPMNYAPNALHNLRAYLSISDNHCAGNTSCESDAARH